MEEDVNVNFDGYDEDLSENPFFKFIQTNHKALYDDVAKHRWIVCVPRKGTLSRSNHTLNDVENHFLQPTDEDGSQSYTTLNGKSVKVNEGFIFTEKGFEDVKCVRILFEETFYNENNERFPVLCLDQPLEGEIGVSAPPVVQVLDNLQGCIDFLWPSSGSKQGQKQIDEIIRVFNSTYQQLEGESLRHLMDAANAIYTRAMQALLKNAQLRKLSQSNKSYMDNLKLAIETYVMHGLYHQIMKGLSSIVGNEDAALNKITRNLAEIQIRDLGIKPELCTNLPRGRRMLSFLNRYTSPLEKFHCLKKSITIITERKMNDKEPGVVNAITADDLLPALVFLVIKADIPNWLANITFLHNFHFSKCGYTEFQFYLSSLEAAVEHVRSGDVSSEYTGGVPFKRIQSGAAGSYTFWQPVDGSKLTALDMLFEYTAQGNEQQVVKLLNNEETDSVKLDKMCHPLCSCDKCEKLLSRRRNDPSAVTVFSRDDMGRTALHVAAEYGHANLIYAMIHKGAVVNTMDYHGSTPLHMACLRGHSKVVLMLLHYKADVNAVDNDGNTPMHLCVGNGHDQCCKSLVYSDMNQDILKINVDNENGDTPLHLASRWGYVELVDLLIERGASLQAKNKKNQTPLDCALSQQVSEMILDAAAAHMEKETGFLAFLPDKDNKSSSKTLRVPSKGSVKSSLARSPASSLERQTTMKEVDVFLRTVADGDIEMVRFRLCLDEEDDDDSIDSMPCVSEQDLCHPLCQCSKCIKWQKLTQRSVEHNVHVNCSNEDGVTPLHVAAVRGYTPITNLLLRHGADPSAKDKKKLHTPLHLACQYNHPQVTELLINYSAKINAKDYRGNTPLHFCCLNGHVATALVLLENNVDVNNQNDRGNTPLHEAARWNFCDLVRVLLQHGASIGVRNKMLMTPIQYATHYDVVTILKQSEQIAKEASIARRNTWAGLTVLNPSQQKSDILLPNPVEADITPSPPKPSPSVCYSVATKSAEMNHQHRTRSLTDSDVIDTSIEQPKTKLNDIFEQLERGEVEKLQEIAKEVRAFDRRKSLKRTVTNDKSLPFFPWKVDYEAIEEFNQDLRYSHAVFDKTLRHSQKDTPSSKQQAPQQRSPLLDRVRNVLLDSPPTQSPPRGLLQNAMRIANATYGDEVKEDQHGAVLDSIHPELESIVREEINAMDHAATFHKHKSVLNIKEVSNGSRNTNSSSEQSISNSSQVCKDSEVADSSPEQIISNSSQVCKDSEVADSSPEESISNLDQVCKDSEVADSSPEQSISNLDQVCKDSEVADSSPEQSISNLDQVCKDSEVADYSPEQSISNLDQVCKDSEVADSSPEQSISNLDLVGKDSEVADSSPEQSISNLSQVGKDSEVADSSPEQSISNLSQVGKDSEVADSSPEQSISNLSQIGKDSEVADSSPEQSISNLDQVCKDSEVADSSPEQSISNLDQVCKDSEVADYSPEQSISNLDQVCKDSEVADSSPEQSISNLDLVGKDSEVADSSPEQSISNLSQVGKDSEVADSSPEQSVSNLDQVCKDSEVADSSPEQSISNLSQVCKDSEVADSSPEQSISNLDQVCKDSEVANGQSTKSTSNSNQVCNDLVTADSSKEQSISNLNQISNTVENPEEMSNKSYINLKESTIVKHRSKGSVNTIDFESNQDSIFSGNIECSLQPNISVGKDEHYSHKNDIETEDNKGGKAAEEIGGACDHIAAEQLSNETFEKSVEPGQSATPLF